ncbi:MAG: hypothetical protein IKI58_04150 [Oscillospiraceae bacterium]|nr:hypothetical protein [Oscillospiraceae bacterium]
MVQITQKPTMIKYVDDKLVAILDLQVSTVSELPSLGDVIDGYAVGIGSHAEIIQADSPTIVTIDEDDTWYPEQS